jgi:hypothetical protein
VSGIGLSSATPCSIYVLIHSSGQTNWQRGKGVTVGARRRGEFSSSAIDRGWPYQVALSEPAYIGRNFPVVHGFIMAERLSLCARGHGFFQGGIHHHVFCFAEEAHAERFHDRFGGVMMSPDTRPRWPSKPSPSERRSKKQKER